MSKKKRRIRQDNIMLIILIFILVVCFIVFGVLFYKYFYAGVSTSKYGNRLDGIENYKLSERMILVVYILKNHLLVVLILLLRVKLYI